MQSLQVRNRARTALETVPGLAGKVYRPEDTRPSGVTLYAVVTVISAPAINDWGGEAMTLVRLQTDLYSLAQYDSEVLSAAEAARVALEAAGFTRVGSRQPLSFSGERDSLKRLFWRFSTDWEILA